MDILLVEDEADIRQLIYDVLQKEGHHVIAAKNGKQAIDYLMIYKVELIITDIIMPEIEGIELILRLRQSNIPIIPITALSKESLMTELLASLGIVGYLQKPFTRNDLVALIDTVKEAQNKQQSAEQKS